MAVNIFSMTGFSRTQNQFVTGEMSIEIRSVNHRFLEISFKLPEVLRPLEIKLREQITKRIHRGKLDIFVNFIPKITEQQLNLNHALLHSLKKVESSLNELYPITNSSFLEWLRYPGILDIPKYSESELEKNIVTLMDKTLIELNCSRQKEGNALALFLMEKIESAFALIENIELKLPQIMTLQQKKLEQRLSEFWEHEQTTKKIDPERLYQEIAFLLQKADVSEEISRFKTHLIEFKACLNKGGNIGRKLDFLIQELVREVNTLGAKSINAENSHQIIELKLTIEQMREQVQNIE